MESTGAQLTAVAGMIFLNLYLGEDAVSGICAWGGEGRKGYLILAVKIPPSQNVFPQFCWSNWWHVQSVAWSLI